MKRKIIVIVGIILFLILSCFVIFIISSSPNFQLFGTPHYKAQDNHTYDKGSKIDFLNTDSTTINRLEKLGKVWGFLKYYHPDIQKGDYNMDYELFSLIPKYISETDPKKREDILEQWVLDFGDFKENGSAKPQQEIKYKPDFSWINNHNFSKSLTHLLLDIKESKRGTENYYVEINRMGIPSFPREDAYKNMKYPDQGFRLLALFRYWNIIEYFYPYKYLIDEDSNWDKVLKEFIPRFIEAKNEREYNLAILELVSKIEDSHAQVSENAFLKQFRGKRYPNLTVTFVSDTLVVDGVLNKNEPKNSVIKNGDIILKINNLKVSEIAENRFKYISASNQSTKWRNFAMDILRTNQDEINITYLRNGKTNKTTLKTFPYEDGIALKWFQNDKPAFQLLSDSIGYLYLGSLQEKEIPGIFKKLKGTQGLIIDLRTYPKEFVVKSLGKHLIPQEKPFVRLTKTSIQNPGVFTFFHKEKIGGTSDAYQGKIVVLVNEFTQSQSEYTAMGLEKAPKTQIIGSTTACADGNVTSISLPGGIKTYFSGLGVYYPNGKETQRVGIVPDIEVKPTVEGIKKRKDEVLDKAIEVIEE